MSVERPVKPLPGPRTRRRGLVAAVAAAVGFAVPPADAMPVPCTQKRCDGKCVAFTPANGCGAAGCTKACGVVGAQPACKPVNGVSTCDYETCQSGRLDLDGKRQNGCEAIDTPYIVFQIPTTFTLSTLAGATNYQFKGVAGGRTSTNDDRHDIPATFYLRVEHRDTAAAIDRCLAIAAGMPSTSKAWLELHASGGKIVQVPYTYNDPPGYGALRLLVRDQPDITVACHVNLKPPD